MSRHSFREGAPEWISSINLALEKIAIEASLDQWDGKGSIAVSVDTLSMADAVLCALQRLLPIETPVPDIDAEADGEIGVTWTRGAAQMFWFSVNANGQLSFAGRFGSAGEDHGWRPIDRSSLKALDHSVRPIVQHILRLFPDIPRHDRLLAEHGFDA